MTRSKEHQFVLNIQKTVDKISSTSQLSREDYLQLATAVLSDYNVTEQERSQINRIFDDIHLGRIKIVN